LYKHQAMVREFHKAFNLVINDVPTIPPDPCIQLRINLNNDEEVEYIEGVINKDLGNCIHELCDIIYVACGAAVAWGIEITEDEAREYFAGYSSEWVMRGNIGVNLLVAQTYYNNRPAPKIPGPRELAAIIHDVHQGCVHFEAASKNKDIDAIRSCIFMLLRACYDGLLAYGINMRPFFDQIHEANMGKLWPDGKVHYRSDGKVEKPPTYSKEKIKASFDAVLESQKGTE
jgi:predicted HAD superfamily Cof-like phosphohydrolase